MHAYQIHTHAHIHAQLAHFHIITTLPLHI